MRLFLIMLLLLNSAAAQQDSHGHQGEGHDTWHEQFYQGLVTPETKVSCCSLADCRPTQGKQVGDHYEVEINGNFIRVLPNKVVKKSAPDGGYHVCAPIMFDGAPEHVYCVVLPAEG